MSREDFVGKAGYDVIGDVHGYADKLEGLLHSLGYAHADGAWRHPDRTVIFIGDLIDRGPAQCRTVDLARAMVISGSAQIVMGNHEFNAIAWATEDPNVSRKYLRPHEGVWGPGNRHQHKEFLAEVGEDSDLHRDYIDWFRSLPLWLDLGELRIVHACWRETEMDVIRRQLEVHGSLTVELMVEATREGSDVYEAIEILLKGPEISLPDGLAYHDKDGIPRHEARARWWDDAATTLRGAAEIPSDAKTLDGSPFPLLPDTPLGDGMNAPYHDAVPVLYGHYWRTGKRRIDTSMTACVDYSAGKGGPLVAYRWNQGDRELSSENFVAYPASTTNLHV